MRIVLRVWKCPLLTSVYIHMRMVLRVGGIVHARTLEAFALSRSCELCVAKRRQGVGDCRPLLPLTLFVRREVLPLRSGQSHACPHPTFTQSWACPISAANPGACPISAA